MIKTKQFAHQAAIYDAHKSDRYFALFWEMGLGKTKTIIDVASYLFEQKKITGMLVLAPNSVYANWILHEIPAHMGVPYSAHRFRTNEKSVRHEAIRTVFLDPQTEQFRDTLRVAAMSYDAIGTDHGMDFAQRFVALHRTMCVADESTAIKSGRAIRSKRAKKIASYCHYRWIATGTPVAQSPFDIHSQVEFLDPEFWKRFGVGSIVAFRNQFGVFQNMRLGKNVVSKTIAYRDLDKLQEMIAPISSRLLKEDSEVKLPPKVYSVRSFELTKRQREIYDQLKDELIAEIESDPASFVEAPLAVTKLMRLQQICSGFVTAVTRIEELDDEDGLRPVVLEKEIVDVVDPSDNPRLELLFETIECIQHKVIIWCRFRRDVDLICDALGDRAVRYDGSTGQKQRELALSSFSSAGGPQFFVANIHAISMGVTLNIAKTAVYYTNSYSLEKRLQSEDRFHRIGQDSSVQIIDIVAEDTTDEKIVGALRKKFDIAAMVTGDRLREWIS